MARWKKGTACAFCRSTDRKLTRDHVPPKELFADRRNLIVVPACEICNKRMNHDEEYFRLMLLPHDRIAEHPEAQKLMPAIYRSLEKPEKSKMARKFVQGFRMIDTFTPTGIPSANARVVVVATPDR